MNPFFQNPDKPDETSPAPETLTVTSRASARAKLRADVDAFLQAGNVITQVRAGLQNGEVEFNFAHTAAARRCKKTITEIRAAHRKSARRGGNKSRSAKRQQSTI